MSLRPERAPAQRSSAYLRRLSACSLAFVSFGLIGCGDDEVQTTNQRGIPAHLRKKNTPSRSKTSSQGAQGTSVKPGGLDLIIPSRMKRKELLSSAGWRSNDDIREQLDEMRDPFWPDIPELKDKEKIEVDPTSVQRKLVVAVPVPPQTLLFKGSLTGIEVNLAMLEDSGGTGYTVRVGDIIGRNPEFVRVRQITSNEIRFEPILGIPDHEPEDSPKLLKRLQEDDNESSTSGFVGAP